MQNEYQKSYTSLLTRPDCPPITRILINKTDSDTIKNIVTGSDGKIKRQDITNIIEDILHQLREKQNAKFEECGIVDSEENYIRDELVASLRQFSYGSIIEIFNNKNLTIPEIEQTIDTYGYDEIQRVLEKSNIPSRTNDLMCNLSQETLENIGWIPFSRITKDCETYKHIEEFINKHSNNPDFVSALISNENLPDEFRDELYEGFSYNPLNIKNGTKTVVDNLYRSCSESLFAEEIIEQQTIDILKNLLIENHPRKEHLYDLTKSLNGMDEKPESKNLKSEIYLGACFCAEKSKSDEELSEMKKFERSSIHTKIFIVY